MYSFIIWAFPVLVAEAARVKHRRDGANRTASLDCFSPYDQKPLVAMQACNTKELEAMLLVLQKCTTLSDSQLPTNGNCAELVAVCSSEQVQELEQEFADKVSVVKSDAGAYYREVSGPAKPYITVQGVELSEDFYSEWRDYDARMDRIDVAVAASGGVAKLEIAGQSLEGRDIKVVRFTGQGYAPGMPKVLLTFNIHAREWMAGMAGVYAVEKLVEKVKGSPGYLDGMEVVMIPMANPDGFVYSQGLWRFHRKNMNPDATCTGVDLNRNFPFQWNTVGSSDLSCLDTYHGEGPASEPETQAIKSVMDESKMTVMLDVHAFSQLILSGWGYTTDDHPRKDEFNALGVKMQDAMESRHGETYDMGPGAQLLYAVGGDISDYATSMGALGYCYELRPKSRLWSLVGFAPPASMIQPTVEECFDGIGAAIDYAKTS